MTTAASRYPVFIRRTAVACAVIDEEIAYYRRTWGYAHEQSLARLAAWGTMFPWIRAHVGAALNIGRIGGDL